MSRALLLLAVLALTGCGDDTTSGASTDLSQPVLDLSQPGAIMCGTAICTSNVCSACVPLGGGVCVPPCTTANPDSCTAPAMCHPIAGDADGGSGASLAGDCAGYDGYCG